MIKFNGFRSNNDSKFFTNNNSSTISQQMISYANKSNISSKLDSVAGLGSIISRGYPSRSMMTDERMSTYASDSQRAKNTLVKDNLDKYNKEFLEQLDCVSTKINRDSCIMFDPNAHQKKSSPTISGMPIEIHLDDGKKVIKLVELIDNSFNIIKIHTDHYEGKLVLSTKNTDNVDFYVSRFTSNPSEADHDFHYKKTGFTLKVTNGPNDPKYIYIKMLVKFQCNFELQFICEEAKGSTARVNKMNRTVMPFINKSQPKPMKKAGSVSQIDHGKYLRD